LREDGKEGGRGFVEVRASKQEKATLILNSSQGQTGVACGLLRLSKKQKKEFYFQAHLNFKTPIYTFLGT
jgi:hypothetical protein